MVMRLLTAPSRGQEPVWFVIDGAGKPGEAATAPYRYHREPEEQESTGAGIPGKGPA